MGNKNDIAMVVDALKNCLDIPQCRNCHWKTCECIDHQTVELPRDLAEQALALVEAQKPKKVIYESNNRFCPECKMILMAWAKYCPMCGQAVVV